MTDPLHDKLAYTVREAAAATGLGRTTLFKEMRKGRLGWKQYGKKRIIPRGDLVALIMRLEDGGVHGGRNRAGGNS